jgi:hypothetical protein
LNPSKPPDWAHWLAMDLDGSWWYYEAEPHQHDTGWYENEVGRYQRVAHQPVPDQPVWKHSLTPLNNELRA